MSDLNTIFAQNLRRYREENGFTQLDLANQAGLTVRRIAKLEKAQGSPRILTIDALADALGVTVIQLLAIHENKTPPPDAR
ncbi:MAG: hypothetical protein BGO03_12025 [Mesorhizobium sp. 61-13]|nr:MAG: hypothetical protein BGO03_12025 [Mesorhizobium sp. 61-13]